MYSLTVGKLESDSNILSKKNTFIGDFKIMTNNEVKSLKGAVSTYNQLVKKAVEKGLLETTEGINKVFAGADKNKKCYVKLSDDELKGFNSN